MLKIWAIIWVMGGPTAAIGGYHTFSRCNSDLANFQQVAASVGTQLFGFCASKQQICSSIEDDQGTERSRRLQDIARQICPRNPNNQQ
jgi:ligand-binding sensor protein